MSQRSKRPWVALTVTALVVALASCAPNTGSTEAEEGPAQSEGPAALTIWADPAREAMVDAYITAHPDVEVTVEIIPQGPVELGQKLQLANQARGGWPDLVFSGYQLAQSLNAAPYDFAAQLNEYVPADVVEDFAPGALSVCRDGDVLFCLRNDIAPTVVLYNDQLMQQFGYEVPTTWEELETLGLRVAAEHPGYIVGSAANNTSDTVFFAAARCPVHQVVGDMELLTDLSEEGCTRIARLLDTLVAADAMSILPAQDPQFVSEYGAPQKVLLNVGPIFQATAYWQQLYETPPGVLKIAPPLRWQADDRAYSGSAGGGAWVVSRHSEFKQAAVDAALWFTTGAPVMGQVEDFVLPTFPAYQPAQATWAETQEQSGYLTAYDGDLAGTARQATESLWEEWTLPNIPNIDFTFVMAAMANGATIESQLPAWQERITQEARAAGWTVVEP